MTNKVIHPDDAEMFTDQTDLEALRSAVFSTQQPEAYRFRKNVGCSACVFAGDLAANRFMGWADAARQQNPEFVCYFLCKSLEICQVLR